MAGGTDVNPSSTPSILAKENKNNKKDNCFLFKVSLQMLESLSGNGSCVEQSFLLVHIVGIRFGFE